jgi:hypothetical protein
MPKQDTGHDPEPIPFTFHRHTFHFNSVWTFNTVWIFPKTIQALRSVIPVVYVRRDSQPPPATDNFQQCEAPGATQSQRTLPTTVELVIIRCI